jgi:hypothetical protein
MACSGELGSHQDGFVQRDSVGITIYESSQLGPQVEATERIRIGAVDGPIETTFNRVNDARLGPDGMLLILDRGDHLIKVFDEAGTPLRTVGGEGQGPAEFLAASNLTLSGDTLWVLDWRLQKVTGFDIGGALLHTRRIEYSLFQHGSPAAFTRRPGGRLVIVGTTGGCALPRRSSDNLWRVYTMGADGTIQDTLIRDEIKNSLAAYTANTCTAVSWPFGPAQRIAFDSRGGAFRSTGRAFEIVQLDTTLTRVRTIMRYAAPDRPVTSGDREAFEDQLDEREGLGADLRGALKQAVDSVGYPETWPAITELKLAGPDTVWAQRARPTRDEHQEWDVLIVGRHARTVVLPGRLRVIDIRGNRILGVLADDLDVQYVAVFSVPPSDPESSP